MEKYNFIKQAIIVKSCLTVSTIEGIRYISPHCIGSGKNNTKKLLAYQYKGAGKKPLPKDGDWRCFEISDLLSVERNGDSWHTGDSHKKRNTCVTRMDLEIGY